MKIYRVAVLTMMVAGTVGTVFAQSGFSAKDKMFLKGSTQANMAEIKMAQLALSKTSNDAVKSFSQQMITDHQGLIDSTNPVAEKARVTPPADVTPMQGRVYRMLSALSGDDFDKAYMAEMVKGHQKDLETVKTEAEMTENDAMKALASHAAEVIRQHARSIDETAQKVGVNATAEVEPPAGGGSTSATRLAPRMPASRM